MQKITLIINENKHEVEVDPDVPLLWVLRDTLNLTGTKYGCGIGVCGSCTVLIDGAPRNSCRIPASQVARRKVVTIEGLDTTGQHPVQRAWNEEDVPQCGYCQGGQILNAVALLRRKPIPNDEDINEAMKSVVCRCGTYNRIRKAIKLAAQYAAAIEESA